MGEENKASSKIASIGAENSVRPESLFSRIVTTMLSLVLVGIFGFFAYDAGWKAFTVFVMVLVIGALESFVKPPNILRFSAKAGLTVFVMWWIVQDMLPIKTFLGLVGVVFMCGVVILGGFCLTDGEWW